MQRKSHQNQPFYLQPTCIENEQLNIANIVGKYSINAKKQRKTDLFFVNASTFELQRKRYMALKLFKIQQQIKIYTFLINLTQFEKTALKGMVYIPL